ncbi:type I DNA topoisomerase [Candidatus Falkowbacteria bacterium]|nr:type I DNA topoisomerase [Candidatus Falkowbacteria bacterium]
MKLVIVESPTKAKTISRFLGTDFKVDSSFGHVRDLPKSKLGVDVEKDFTPQYVVPKDKLKHLNELKKAAVKAETVYYATDEDREGEAIAWHLADYFGLEADKEKRIAFHEITKEAVEEALAHPRHIDMNLVDAQQARRVVDRLVGYKLSPFLWKKVARGLSAGRVQSVAVRLIVEREREIAAFKTDEYWSLEAEFKAAAGSFAAKLYKVGGKVLDKLGIQTQAEADALLQTLSGAAYKVASVEKKEVQKNPLPPFSTSTLQQEANRRLGFSAKQTMMIAQQLYEGLLLGSGGQVGLITYMRTDSLNLSEKFLAEAAGFIKSQFGAEFALSGARRFKTKSKGAQEAHEAVRPTEAARQPESIKAFVTPQQYRLYDLIWRRALASQMAPAVMDASTVDVGNDKNDFIFRATGQVVKFAGFLKVYFANGKEVLLPDVRPDESLALTKLAPLQHFTQPPARYNDATLVKALEERGIGRPSTYAPTIATIIDRGYVARVEKRLQPNDIAMLVNDLLVEHFPQIVDYDFTAKMEGDLDSVAEGTQAWRPLVADFYGPFDENLQKKTEELSRQDIAEMKQLGEDPQTHQPIFVRLGRFGPFVQRGGAEDAEKPTFAAIPRGRDMGSITLDDALQYLSLPKILGTDADGQDIEVSIGRFGPYVKVGTTYYNFKEENPYTLTLDQARKIIVLSQETKKKAEIKVFADAGITVKVGRFGPYITNGTTNARVPKDTEPETLTLEQCQAALAEARNKPKRFTRRRKKSTTS